MKNRSLALLLCLGLLVGVACRITLDDDSPQLHFGWLRDDRGAARTFELIKEGHNQHAQVLKALLWLHGGRNVAVSQAPLGG